MHVHDIDLPRTTVRSTTFLGVPACRSLLDYSLSVYVRRGSTLDQRQDSALGLELKVETQFVFAGVLVTHFGSSGPSKTTAPPRTAAGPTSVAPLGPVDNVQTLKCSSPRAVPALARGRAQRLPFIIPPPSVSTECTVTRIADGIRTMAPNEPQTTLRTRRGSSPSMRVMMHETALARVAVPCKSNAEPFSSTGSFADRANSSSVCCRMASLKVSLVQ